MGAGRPRIDEPNTKQVVVPVSEAQNAKLFREVERRGVTRAALLRSILAEWLEKNQAAGQ
jgi:hypothetical protein